LPLAALPLAALLMAGCASDTERPVAVPSTPPVDSLPAPQIVAQAQRALAQAASVHVTGTFSQQGKTVQFDMRIAEGKKATGSVTTDGVRVDLRRLGDRLYVKGDDKFLAALGEKAIATKGRWLVAPVAQADKGLANLSDLAQFASTLSPGSGVLTKETVRKLGGRDAVSVRSATGARLYVADTGNPVPLRIERLGAATGFIDYGDYDAPVDVTAPSPTVDLVSVTG
jgi:hypothetical protein